MANKTEGVKILVQDVLRTFAEPHGEDIIRDVCFAIETTADWHRRYDVLKDELTDDVANNRIGKYTKELTGLNSLRQVSVKGKHIITSYTKLGR
jgi:hypothetical protein